MATKLIFQTPVGGTSVDYNKTEKIGKPIDLVPYSNIRVFVHFDFGAVGTALPNAVRFILNTDKGLRLDTILLNMSGDTLTRVYEVPGTELTVEVKNEGQTGYLQSAGSISLPVNVYVYIYGNDGCCDVKGRD